MEIKWKEINKDKCLKGVCHEMFYLSFSWFAPIWVPDQQTKQFLILLRFRKEIQIFKKLKCSKYLKKLRGVKQTAESNDLKIL